MTMKLHLYLIVYFVIFILNKHGYGHLIRYYLGCYQSFHPNVVLLTKSSVTSCIEECKTQSQMSTFAALKNGNECYCGNDFRTSTQERNCQKRCKESSSEFCGGEQHYSVYSICLIGSHGRNCDKQCSNCQNSVPCLRNNGECFSSKCSKTSQEKCDIARFFNDVNVALNRPAHQSSTYPHFHASLAVDGNNNTNVNDGRTCSHTENEENPWFYVDLEMERNIKKVIITNREDNDTGNAKRLLQARVSLSNKHPPTPERDLQSCGTVTKLQNIEITCSSHNKYRYLVVTLPKKEFLTICEIEAYMEDCKSCEGNEECTYVNNNRNRRCTCRSGFFKDNIYSPCTDINECADNSHSCNTTMSACQNHDGGYSCKCNPGYEPKGSNNINCYDVDECRNNKHQCDVTSTTCSNNVGSYVCNCKAGYQYSSAVKCVDIDECRTNHSCNTTTSSCINNVGSYTCQCRAGYVNYGNNIKCADFDECQNNKHSCDITSTTCRNTDGSYRCECKTGYQQDYHHPNKCKDIDECSNTSPCDSTTSTCRNTDGSYICECKTGYQRYYHPHGCVDINECDQRKCDDSSTTCENVIGSFKCLCKPGFKMLDSTSCSDIDECEGNNHNCDLSTTTCTNDKGNFSCDCKLGFEKINSNNTSCKDIDECSRNVCDGKSTNCQNNIGSYLCHCKDGYSRLHQNKCSDINECSLNTHDCDKQTTTCQNIGGGYYCICLSGYENIPGNNRSCTDINECEKVAYNMSTVCHNTIGSFELQCREGFEKRSGVCEDVDECQIQKFDSNVNCTNSIGSVKFLCRDGYYLVEDGKMLTCKAHTNAGKIVAGFFVMLLLAVLGALFVFLWKRKQNEKYKEKMSPKACELSNTTKQIPQTEVIYNNVDTKQSATRIRTEDLSDHIRAVSEKDSSGFENEFKAIPKVMEMSTSYAQQQELKPLNRFQNIFPYDHTRIILSNTGEEFSDYINASHITGFENTVPLIAAQGPTEQTVNDFWRMITEQNVNVIVMLTQLVENNKEKCFLYWPESEGSATEFGNISVANSSVVVWEKFVRRDFVVVKKDDNSKGIVTQWQFLGWPDHGVPTDVQSFLRFRNNVRAWADKSGKILVHCSAGVGRTGCFIAIDVLLEETATRGSVDVVSCVSELRRQRPHMVQTAVQYDFIYFALKLAFEEGSVYIPIPSFHKRYLEMFKTNKEGKSKIVEEFENLIKATSEEIKNSSTSKELTTQSDKWNVYSADSVNTPNKYMFARFPSESDVEKFWEMCMEHANVIVLLDHIKDFKLPFLPNNIKSLICKGFTLDFASTLPMGILSVDTVTASSQKDLIYENRTDLKNQSRQFRVIRVCMNNKDFLTKELFQAIKVQADLVPNNNPPDGSMPSKFVVSRDNMKLASFYVACCKLFEQMESYKEVTIYNTVLDLHKGSYGPTFTLAQYKKLYEIVDKEVIARKPFQLL